MSIFLHLISSFHDRLGLLDSLFDQSVIYYNRNYYILCAHQDVILVILNYTD